MSQISAQNRVVSGRSVRAAVKQERQEAAAFPLRVLATVAGLMDCNTMAGSNGLQR